MNLSPYPPLGLQPIIFGKQYDTTKPDQLDALLGVIASAGYQAVEAGPPDVELFKGLLKKHGLTHAANHVTISRSTDPAPVIAFMNATGARDVCNSGLLRWGDDLTGEDYERSIETLNRMGKAFRAEGIHFHYHNHAFEFERVDGGATGMERLLAGLDFSVVDFCIDVAWVHRGGEDPGAYLLRHADKIGYVHLKDTDAEHWKELGRGVLDWNSVMTAVRQLPSVRWAMVEQDSTDGDPAACIRTSREFLKSTFVY